MTTGNLRFKVHRIAAGISQRELAEALNTHEVTVSRWETGRNVPDRDVQERVARLLGVHRWELWEGR